MQTKTTNFALVLFVTFLVAGSATPTLAAAPARRTTPTPTTTTFCANFDTQTTKLQTKAAEKEIELGKTREERSGKLAKSRESRDNKLEEAREKGSTARTEQYAKLLGKATTDAQKQAVATYQATITAAIATRQAAVNAAIASFQSGVDGLLAKRKTDTDSALKKFKDAVYAAEAKAKADCAAGVDEKTIRQTLRTAVAAVRTQLQADRKVLTPMSTEIATLTKTRRAAVDKAFADFKATAETAKTTLKAAFPK